MNKIVDTVMTVFVIGLVLFILGCAGLALGSMFAWIMGL